MKRIFTALLLIAALAGSAFGQETTIISRSDIDASNAPATMLSWTTNGIFYDEWDIILRSPAELSNYEGFGLYTAYGNYQSWRTTPIGTTVNPFMTSTFTPSDFYLGATMPIFSFRAGAIMGFDGSLVPNYGGVSTEEDGNTDTVHDATGLLNQYAWNWSSSYTDFTQNNAIRMGTGIDLGFMGVSLYGDIDASTRKMGGLYSYTYTKSTTAADTAYVQANDIMTSYTAAIGGNADGTPQAFAADGGWNMGIVAEYPLFDWLPITANIYFGGDGNASTAPAPADLPATLTYSIANLTGATTSTATYTRTEAAGTWSDYELATPAAEQDPASFTGFTAANEAVDLANYKNSTFILSGSVMTEPSFDLADSIGFNGIFTAGYTLNSQGVNDAYIYSESFTGATGATLDLNRVTASHSYTESADRTIATNVIALDIGGIFEMSAIDERLVFGLGIVVSPSFSGRASTFANAVQTETWTLTDPANTIADQVAVTTTAGAAALMTDAAAIASQGTKTETITTVYADTDSVNTTSISFLIPVSAKLKLTEKWTLYSGYDIGYSVSSVETVTATRTTTTAYAVANAAGASVYAPTDADAPTVTPGTRTVDVSSTAPAGRMGFMVRWTPTETITVDLAGTSVMTALDFDLLGGNGFNPHDFISSLSMSISFRL